MAREFLPGQPENGGKNIPTSIPRWVNFPHPPPRVQKLRAGLLDCRGPRSLAGGRLEEQRLPRCLLTLTSAGVPHRARHPSGSLNGSKLGGGGPPFSLVDATPSTLSSHNSGLVSIRYEETMRKDHFEIAYYTQKIKASPGSKQKGGPHTSMH